jgi:hypothetical protein
MQPQKPNDRPTTGIDNRGQLSTSIAELPTEGLADIPEALWHLASCLAALRRPARRQLGRSGWFGQDHFDYAPNGNGPWRFVLLPSGPGINSSP